LATIQITLRASSVRVICEVRSNCIESRVIYQQQEWYPKRYHYTTIQVTKHSITQLYRYPMETSKSKYAKRHLTK
jgi:hypothetical protein